MIIESTKVIVKADPAKVFEFLADANNLIHLLPQDKISDFKSTTEECSFKVQGGVTISLIEDGRLEGEELYLRSGKFSPFPFRLSIRLTATEGGCEGYIYFDGDVNAFLKMVVEKPLTNLFNYMSQKLCDYYQ